tara:strand:- start:2763 stop:3254 length:492 start_codon:yes stop_codon:yes gene_type:complete
MPLLHFRITSKDQPINLSRTLHAQNLTLRRAIITKTKSLYTVASAPSADTCCDNAIPAWTPDYKGGVIVDCSFLRGYEIMSNFSSNDILLPFSNGDTNINTQFELDIASEDIALSFNVKTYDFDRKDTILFVGEGSTVATTPGAIKSIDLIFQYDQLYNYNTY